MSKKNSFTLIELLVIIGTMIVLMALAAPAFRIFQKESELTNSAEEIINTLRLAQNKTLASEGASQWGVYFSTSTSPQQYVLFQGTDYDSRVVSSDEIHKLPKSIEIYEINFEAIVFERISGKVSASIKQSISLRLKADPSKTRTIYIENSGQVGLE